MPKTLYKKTRPPKIFYSRQVKFRSTAYGEDVRREFLVWHRFFYEKWNSKNENFLLFEQGDVGASPIRYSGGYSLTSGISRLQDVEPLKSVSVLPPLWKGKLLLEVEKTGYLRVNGTRERLNLGADLKAWAILSLADGSENRLYVVGKPISETETFLTEFPLTEQGVGEPTASFGLEASIELSDRLVCFGRHIFLTHDEKLRYYYLSPQTGKPEQVAIGNAEDATWIRHVHLPIVADGRGNVYWSAEDGVYTFKIGYPASLRRLAAGVEVDKLTCRGDQLFVCASDKNGKTLLCYHEKEDGSFTGERFRVQADIVLSHREAEVEYISLQKRIGRTYALVCVNDGKNDRMLAQIELGVADNAFYYFGNLVADADYVGRVDNNKLIRIK